MRQFGVFLESIGLPSFIKLNQSLWHLLRKPTVSVGPRVLVPESNHVSQLVYNNALLVAILAYRDGLRFVLTTSSHV